MKKLSDYIGKKIAVNCTTPEQAEAFCKLMHENGLKWASRKSYLGDTRWSTHEKNTCYCVNENFYNTIDYFINQGYTILPATDFLEEEFVYGQEYEFSDYKDFKYSQIEKYLCKRPDGKFLAWNGLCNCAFTYDYCRKINTERTEAITTAKELITKFDIKQEEIY